MQLLVVPERVCLLHLVLVDEIRPEICLHPKPVNSCGILRSPLCSVVDHLREATRVQGLRVREVLFSPSWKSRAISHHLVHKRRVDCCAHLSYLKLDLGFGLRTLGDLKHDVGFAAHREGALSSTSR